MGKRKNVKRDKARRNRFAAYKMGWQPKEKLFDGEVFEEHEFRSDHMLKMDALEDEEIQREEDDGTPKWFFYEYEDVDADELLEEDEQKPEVGVPPDHPDYELFVQFAQDEADEIMNWD